MHHDTNETRIRDERLWIKRFNHKAPCRAINGWMVLHIFATDSQSRGPLGYNNRLPQAADFPAYVCRRIQILLTELISIRFNSGLYGTENYSSCDTKIQFNKIFSSLLGSLMVKAFDSQWFVPDSRLSWGMMQVCCCWFLWRMKQVHGASMIS